MMAAPSNSARIMEQIEVEPSRSVGQVVGVQTPEPQVQSRKYRVGRSEKWSAFGRQTKTPSLSRTPSTVNDDSSRRPLPFAGLFALFGHRAALLLFVVPCVNFLIVVVLTIAWAAGTVPTREYSNTNANNEQMALLEVPWKFAYNLLYMLLAWQLHVVNRPGGPYAVLKQQRLPKRLHRWVRNFSLMVLVMSGLSLVPIVLLALSGLAAVAAAPQDEVAWYTPLRTINAVVWLMGFPLLALNSCQTAASIAAVVSELRDVAALIESCEESSWGTVVIPAAKRAMRVTHPAFGYWGLTSAAFILYFSYNFLLNLLQFTVDPRGGYAANAALFLVAVLICLAVVLQIDVACKAVEKALSRRALDKLETSPAAAEPALALREVLCRGGSWGCKLLGVRVNKKLLLRIAGASITLLTLLTKFVDEGEPESASGI